MGTDAQAQDAISEILQRPLAESAARKVVELTRDVYAEVVYLSTPITTGASLLNWLANNRSEHAALDTQAEVVRDEVIAENLSRLGPLRESIRKAHPNTRLVDPTVVEEPEWSQTDYHRFWVEVLNRVVDRIVFADGWHLSTGCAVEYAAGLQLGLPMADATGEPLLPSRAAAMLTAGAATLRAAGRDESVTSAAARRAERATHERLKDDDLAALAEQHNVAAFVSTTPGTPLVRQVVLPGGTAFRGHGLTGLVQRLLLVSRSGSVNVRTFRPGSSKGNPFLYGLRDVAEVVNHVERFARDGFYCIVNETIDVHDGGVSGVSLGGIVEFAPDDTPRAVESEDAARLPHELAGRLLQGVYGLGAKVPVSASHRYEFSIHPGPVGQRHEPVIVWESEKAESIGLATDVTWPNRFSRLIGDKTFGLMVADALGFPVPTTTVISRRIAPFRFGASTGTGEWWMRTAPSRQTPGRFTTTRGWTDPFAVLAKEDPDGQIAAVLAQEGVRAEFSGATMPADEPGEHLVEGVQGYGDEFMLGSQATVELPGDVVERVQTLVTQIEVRLGPGARIEWAADEHQVWILQLHRTKVRGSSGRFSPGNAETWLRFDPSRGLDELSELIDEAHLRGAGIEVTKPIGLTSHVGDLLRKANVPGRLADSI